MIQQISGLAASYGRRAWCVGVASAAMTTGALAATAPAWAQDGAQVAQNAQTGSQASDTAGDAKAKTKTTTTTVKSKTADGKTTTKTTKTKTTAKPSGTGGGASAQNGTTGQNAAPSQGRGGRAAGQAPVPGGVAPGAPPITTLPQGAGGRGQGRGQFGGGQFGGGRFGGGQFGGGQGGNAFGGRGAGTPFQFDFHGSDIDNVLRFFSNMSGLTITKDPALTGPVTIINPRAVTLDEAFKILQSVLYVRGFSAVQNSGVLQILPFAGARASTPLFNPGLNEDGTTLVDPRNQFMTQIIPVENVDAESLARELKDLVSPNASLIGSPGTNALIITDTASNVSRFISIVDALDKSSNKTDLKIYSLQRADASSIAQIITGIYTQTTTRGRGQGGQGGGQPGQPGFNPGNPQQQGGASAGRPAVVAVADPSTNSVLVVASPDNQERIARDIIGRLDGDSANRLETITRKINFANAQTVADLVNTVLSNSRPGGGNSGQPSFQQRIFGGGGGFGGGGFGGFGGGGFGGGGGQQGQGSSDPFGKVVADPRTNTVLITASQDRLGRINDLIDKLDQEVPVEATTFVFPLKNAQAQDISTALGQAFGTTGSGLGNGNSFFNFGGSNSSSNRNPFSRTGSGTGTNRRQGTTSSPFGRGVRSSVPPGPPPAPEQGNSSGDEPNVQTSGGSAQPQGIEGVMTDQGFVPTATQSEQNGGQTRSRQAFGFGGGRGGGQSQGGVAASAGNTLVGPGRSGSYSNLLQLQNNVFVTPSPNGDSVIVTTTPQNYEAIRQIIDALDIVPRQVMIEVIVAEVTLTDDQKLGFTLGGNLFRLFSGANTAQGQINNQAPGFGTGFDTLAGGAQFVINGTNYNALLQALTTDNKVHVLATPRVFASNNQLAEIDITQNIPFIQGTTTTGFSSVVSNTVQTAPVGFQLQVTPRITRQGLVSIDVVQEADDLLRFQTLGSGVNASVYPVINQRYTDTTVTIQDNQTVVIGGLIRENRALNIQKIPVLADIPLIGQFFRSREVTHDKTELMIFMTPHVVNTTEDARQLALREGAPLIRQIPDLSKQQPNLTLPVPPKDAKIDPKTLPTDSTGHPYYPGPNGGTNGVGVNNGDKTSKAPTSGNTGGTGTGAGSGTGTGTGSGTGNGTGTGTGSPTTPRNP